MILVLDFVFKNECILDQIPVVFLKFRQDCHIAVFARITLDFLHLLLELLMLMSELLVQSSDVSFVDL